MLNVDQNNHQWFKIGSQNLTEQQQNQVEIVRNFLDPCLNGPADVRDRARLVLHNLRTYCTSDCVCMITSGCNWGAAGEVEAIGGSS